MLARLAGSSFLTPESGVDSSKVGADKVVLRKEPQAALGSSGAAGGTGQAPRLRGAGTEAFEPKSIANVLLYGQRDPLVFVYRMHRSEGQGQESNASDEEEAATELREMVAAQRPAGPTDEL